MSERIIDKDSWWQPPKYSADKDSWWKVKPLNNNPFRSGKNDKTI